MKTVAEARRLAETMVRIGEDAGVRTEAMLSSMEQPLGRAVGNALEVAEAVDILRGTGPADVTEICLHETATLLALAGLVADERKATRSGSPSHRRWFRSGRSWSRWWRAQGGDPTQIEDTSRAAPGAGSRMLAAPRTGYICGYPGRAGGHGVSSAGSGQTAQRRSYRPRRWTDAAGQGRRLSSEPDAPLVEVHARTEEQAEAVLTELQSAYSWSEEAPIVAPLILGSVTARARLDDRAATACPWVGGDENRPQDKPSNQTADMVGDADAWDREAKDQIQDQPEEPLANERVRDRAERAASQEEKRPKGAEDGEYRA